ncbi:MAG: zinc-ribbon domain-containing protein [Ancalomicrobiaceae bacterium]|nr:zinc-ribbon domain-containing protein [Ancalomicrobiaceae bacterium]
MRITCPVCESSYNIADDKVGAKGRAVRCASCGNKWTVMPSADEPEDDVPDVVEAAAAEAVPLFADPPASEPRRFDAAELPPEFVFPGSASEAATVAPAAAPAAGDDHPHVDVETYAKKVRIRLSTHKPQAYLRLHRIDFERFLVQARPVFGAAVLALSLAVVGMAVLLRAPIVAAFPSLALVYESIGMKVNLRGLEIGKVEMMREVENLQPVLVVEGELENPTTAERDVPAIRFALRGDDQQEIYAWSIEPKATVLMPGANLRFRTRLASPPEQASDIQVRMIDRRKTQASAE